jgi:hypothetical protein
MSVAVTNGHDTEPPVAQGNPELRRDFGGCIIGIHTIVQMAFDRADFSPLWNMLMQRVQANPFDAAAIFDIATILQSLGRSREARQTLDTALSLRRNFRSVHGEGTGLKLLAFVTAGDFMANTPLDFLLVGSDCVLHLHYVDTQTQKLDDLPDHDVAFMAIAESTDNLPVLRHMVDLLSLYPGTIINNRPALVAGLTRDGVSAMLANEPSILSPATCRLSRDVLMDIACGEKALADIAPELSFPLVLRPVSTHAGEGMQKIADPGELIAMLASQTAEQLYAAPFIDFRGSDGLYNKQRVVFIKGRPFASHMALSDHWIVHYLSSGMMTDPAKRDVERIWMETFDQDYAVRHADAFSALYRHIGLDYFGIDCAELPEGRLLVFEVDVAMVVHNMDSPTVFPYKHVAMRKLFDAFIRAFDPARAEDFLTTSETTT